MCVLIAAILAVLVVGLAIQVWVLFVKVCEYEENERRYWDEEDEKTVVETIG